MPKYILLTSAKLGNKILANTDKTASFQENWEESSDYIENTVIVIYEDKSLRRFVVKETIEEIENLLNA